MKKYRFKYKLFNKKSLNDSLKNVFKLSRGNYLLGQYPKDSWIYGEVSLDATKEAELITFLLPYQGVLLTDDEAIAYINFCGDPIGRVVQPKITIQAAKIDQNNNVVKGELVEW